MTPMTDNTIRVVDALERHPRLDVLQIASIAGIAVSAANAAIQELSERGLVESSNGKGSRTRYALDDDALTQHLTTA